MNCQIFFHFGPLPDPPLIESKVIGKLKGFKDKNMIYLKEKQNVYLKQMQPLHMHNNVKHQ